MTVKKETREERDDVFSFWDIQKQLSDNKDTIVEVEVKIEECTLVELEKRISYFETNILEFTAKIEVEKSKLELIKKL